MKYNVYVDLSRQLTQDERSGLFDALDSIVPGSGCVGLQNGRAHDEVYFQIEAQSEVGAKVQVAHYMSLVLQQASLDVSYEIMLQELSRVS